MALSLGAYAFIHLQRGKIPEGTYLIESYYYYDKNKEEMIDKLESFEKTDIENSEFVKVKGNHLKTYGYYISDYSLIMFFSKKTP